MQCIVSSGHTLDDSAIEVVYFNRVEILFEFTETYLTKGEHGGAVG